MDPNDPRYSDTPNVDTHPLEGRAKDRADGYLLVSEAELAEALGTAYDTGWRDHEAGIRPRRSEVVTQRIALAKQQEGRER